MFNLINMLYSVPGAMIALSMHEFGKAYVSDKLGDPTPRQEGKLTINPATHLNPIGFLMILIAGIGWTNPVNINPSYYKNTRQGLIKVFSAGTITNIIVAAIFMVLLRLMNEFNFSSIITPEIFDILDGIIKAIISINVSLGVFLLLPIPQLDGFYFFVNLLPKKLADILYKMEPYSFIILIILIFTKLINIIIDRPVEIILQILYFIVYGII